MTSQHFHRLFTHPLILLFLLAIVQIALPGMATDPADHSSVPAWAKGAVWYQIFPERFRNGDDGNDPTVDDIAGSWPHETPAEWNISSWTGDWYKLQSWEDRDGKDFYFRAQQRRYGGDLQGVIDELDYLKELGVNAIYLNPVFESPSLHKYDATMYHHIDNNFGPDPEGDREMWEREDPSNPETWQWTSADQLFLAFLTRAHELGMRVIIDGVFNHVGMTFWAFRDVVKNGEASPYKDWFIVKSWDNPSTPESEFDYAGWYGVRELPEISEDENGLVSGPREHIHLIVKRWMDPNGDGDPSDGIDGWRLDVAEMVERNFWRTFRQWVREINPEAYLVGEVWWEDWDNGVMFNAEPWLQGDVFDAVMNYRWAREVGHFFKDRNKKITASEFDRRLAALRNDYRTDVNYVLMNLMDSHDTDRLASQIVNVDAEYDRYVGVQGNSGYDVRKPNRDEITIQKLIVLFQMTYPGSPMVFYGGEAGMWGADDPDERKPMLWPDLTYENESHHPFENDRPDDPNVFDADLFRYYREMTRIRTHHPALRLGDFRTAFADDERDLYSFLRSHGDEQILVVVNNSLETHTIDISEQPVPPARWAPLFVSVGSEWSEEGLRLAGKSGAILKRLEEGDR